MSNQAADEDEYEDDDLGPSLAIPPLYVLRVADSCSECRTAMHVYTLGCVAFHDAEDSRPVDVFHFLRLIRSVPQEVLDLLKQKCPGYFLDREERSPESYLMNHCRCGARLDDDYLHGDVGAAFWPDTPEGYGHFKLFRLPIDEPTPIECSFMVGGDEYLNFGGAEEWGAS
jgi:hypothetical protein